MLTDLSQQALIILFGGLGFTIVWLGLKVVIGFLFIPIILGAVAVAAFAIVGTIFQAIF